MSHQTSPPSRKSSSSSGCGCGGCLSLIMFGTLVWFLIVGIATPWGYFSGDLFPPAIHKHHNVPNTPEP